MQERHHVKTTPGEQAPPEIVAHPVRKEEGGNVQTDDINIPMVAVAVAFFAVLLSVTIVGLQAWFYNRDAAERIAKTIPQDDPRTWLGSRLQVQRADLEGYGPVRDLTPATGPAAGRGTAPAVPPANRKMHIPIETAMTLVEKEYAGNK